jgi:hypothetical protein
LGSIRNSPETALCISANAFRAFGSKKCDSDFRKSADFGLFSPFVTEFTPFVTEFSFECSKKIANLSLNRILAFTGYALTRAMEIIPERSHLKRGKQAVKHADLQNVVFAQRVDAFFSAEQRVVDEHFHRRDGAFLSVSQIPNLNFAQ